MPAPFCLRSGAPAHARLQSHRRDENQAVISALALPAMRTLPLAKSSAKVLAYEWLGLEDGKEIIWKCVASGESCHPSGNI